MSKDGEQNNNQFSEENTETMKEFFPGAMGERITYLRKKEKLTQAQLADQLGISAQAVSKWESGLSCPDIMTLVPLARILGVSTDELLGLRSREFAEKCPPNSEYGGMEGDGEQNNGSPEEPREEECTRICEEPAKSKDESAIHTLFISAGACSVRVETGDGFHLRTEGYQGAEIISEVSDGVWRIHDYADKGRIFGIRNAFRARKITVTIPKEHHFDMVRLNIGAGEMEVNGVHTLKSILNAGAGQLTVRNYDVIDAILKCGMGEIDFRGSIWGKCDVECSMGSVKAVLRKIDNYGYSASVGMGDVRIGEYVFSGVSGKQMVNKGADNFYKVSCSMGTVRISFE